MKNLNKENWIEINAKGRTLGRLATEISVYLLGKNKPTYSPDKLSSNFVIITKPVITDFNRDIKDSINGLPSWYKRHKVKENLTIPPPCSIELHSYDWNQNYSFYSGSKFWKTNSLEDKLTSCCRLFRQIYSNNSIEDIFKIMKFSVGLEIPKPWDEISLMNSDGYSVLLFPNDGNFTALEKMG